MDRIIRVAVGTVIGFLLGCCVCWLIDTLWQNPKDVVDGKTKRTVIHELKIDTITHNQVNVRDSVVVSYMTVKRHQTADSVKNLQKEDDDDIVLSVVQIHCTDDSTYDAWVSGVNPRIDSFRVYNRTLTETVTTEIVKTSTKTKPRWGVGIQAGYGTPGPYVGVGIQYNILSF